MARFVAKRIARALVRWAGLVLGLAYLCLTAWPASAETRPPLAWVAPREMLRTAWTLQGAMPAPATVASPAGRQLLEGEQLLLVPVIAGDILRFVGEGVRVGVGSGFGTNLDTITWHTEEATPAGSDLRIPNWGTPRYLVAMAKAGQQGWVEVWFAARDDDAMTWYRLDESVARWLGDAAGTPPSAPYPADEASPVLDWLGEARDALQSPQCRAGLETYLLARWLEDSSRLRPLERPFFLPAPVSLGGGRPGPIPRGGEQTVGSPHRFVGAGARLAIHAPDSDVLAVAVRVRSVGTAVIRFYEAESLTQEITITTPIEATNERRWSPAHMVRLVVPHGAALSAEVVRGEASISVRGFWQQDSAIDFARSRSRKDLLERKPSSGCSGTEARILETLVRAESLKTRAAIDGLRMLSEQAELTPLQRVLVLHETLRLGADLPEIRTLTQRLWAQSEALRVRAKVVMRRSALESVTRVRDPRLHGIQLPIDKGLEDPRVPGDEQLALSALVGAVSHTESFSRVAAAENAERYAAASPLSRRWRELAQSTWRRVTPWSNLAPAATLNTVTRYYPVEPDEPGDPSCAVVGPMGTRWMQLEPADRVRVAPRGGTHTVATFVGDPSRDPEDATVVIDQLPIVVHAGAGLQASVALSPGDHRFSGAGLERVLARIPTDAKFPCVRLREGIRWAVVRGQGTFVIPSGKAMTVASVIVSDSSLDRPVKVSISVGGAVYEGWTRPKATGAMEVPVPAGVTEITVRTDTPLLVRVRARLSPAPRIASEPQAPEQREDSPSEQDLVARVRAATRALGAARTEEEATQARVERIEALELLGYSGYAGADRARLPAGVKVPRAIRSRLWGFAALLPPGRGSVEPLGSLPNITELPTLRSTEGARELRDLIEARALGEPKDAVFTRLKSLAEASSSVDALLLGVLAQERGDHASAARAFERIGRKHGSGVALSRAARLNADIALAQKSLEGTLNAYILARDAFELDGSGTDTLGRLSDAITWIDAPPERSAGEAYVRSQAGIRGTPTLGEQVRRALLDAPDQGSLTENQPIFAGMTRLEHRLIKIVARCHALDSGAESCPFEVEVDGSAAPCSPEGGQPPLGHEAPQERAKASSEVPTSKPEAASPTVRVARNESCYIEVPPGAKRLRVLPPSNRRTLLWAALSAVSSPEVTAGVPVESVVKWFEIDPQHSIKTTVLGPTVLRVSAIGLANQPQRLELRVKALGTQAPLEEHELELGGGASERDFLRPLREPLTVPKLRYVTLEAGGRYEVTLSTREGRAWARLALANAVALPEPEVAEEQAAGSAAVPTQASAASTELPDVFEYTVEQDPKVFPLSVSGEFRHSYEVLNEADDDRRDDYEQLSLTLRRGFPGSALWLRQSSWVRVREGKESFGGRLSLSRASVGALPGIDAQGHVAYQRFDATALGWLAALSVHEPFELGATAAADPGLTMTIRRPDHDANHEPDADSQVFSLYAARRPRSLDISLPVIHRPWVDMLNRYSLEARTLPDFDGFDNVDASVQTRIVAGDGYAPLVRVRVVASYRCQSALRREAFLRTSVAPSVLFWHWTSPFGRITLQGDASYFVDYPRSAGAESEVAGFLALGFDLVGGRGLTDFAPDEKPFSGRLEEGVAPPNRQRRLGQAYWEPER